MADPQSQDEIMTEDLTALTAADIPPENPWDDPDTAMPGELQALSWQELQELYEAAPANPMPAAPEPVGWPLSYLTSGPAGGEDEVSGPWAGFGQDGALDELAAGIALAQFADQAHGALGEMADDPLIGVIRAWRRLTSWAQARELATIAELARRRPAPGYPPGPPGGLPTKLSEFVAAEIAPALTLTARAADGELGLALALRQRPATAAALEAGRIDMPRALVILEFTGLLPETEASAVEAALLPRAGEWTTGQLRARLLRAVLAIDPDAARRRRKEAEKHARVEHWADPEGTATLTGRSLPPAPALAASQRVTAIARAWKKLGAMGGMDRLRAAAYLALLLGQDVTVPPGSLLPSPGDSSAGDDPAPDSQPASGDGQPVPAGLARPVAELPLTGSVNLTIPFRTLLELADAPGEVAGYGPLHADTCRELADALARHRDTRWGVIITNADGYAMGCAGPGRPRGSPPGVGGWTITLTTEPIAPYY